MERYSRLIIILLAVAVSLPVVYKSRPSQHSKAPAAFSVISSGRGYVRVSGDVLHPGIYPLSANIVTRDVIFMAMPIWPIAVLEPPGVGTTPLRSGDALHVVFRTDEKAFVTMGTVPTAERLVLGIPLDINSMSELDLDQVPGIGPALAKQIIQYRHNNGGSMSVQDLLMVDGVGEKKFAALRKYF